VNKSDLKLLNWGLNVFTTWIRKNQKIKQDRQKIDKLEMDLKKIETKANTDLQLIREKAGSKIKIKELDIEELKLKYKIKYGEQYD